MRDPSVLVHEPNDGPVLMVPIRIQDDGIKHKIAGHLSESRRLLLLIGKHMRDCSQNIFDRVIALAKLLGTVVPEPGTS